ncbi:hypothetical protein [Dongia sp.]|uniref:hypothetical protein n=1 Tax=Dongia sp. TaxID=1977262 RepID=UPI0037539460
MLKRKLKWLITIIALSPLSGCPWLMHGPNIWHETGRVVTIDPVTGDKTRTFFWKNDTGDSVTTTDVIPKGEDTDRRNEVRPLPASSDP